MNTHRHHLAADAKLLDRFYTKPAAAGRCMAHLQRAAQRLKVDLRDYWFVEPSAGCGCFYQMLPPRRRIGLDLEPKTTPLTERALVERIEQVDYLTWMPPLCAEAGTAFEPPPRC